MWARSCPPRRAAPLLRYATMWSPISTWRSPPSDRSVRAALDGRRRRLPDGERYRAGRVAVLTRGRGQVPAMGELPELQRDLALAVCRPVRPPDPHPGSAHSDAGVRDV